MAREFKFRAWDTRSGKGKMVKMDPHDPNKEVKGQLTDLVEEPRWKVMQFTGLKDRNGIDVFEDDIVRDGAGQINVVTFGAACYWFNWLHLMDAVEPLEVIGNVHQHPHLLEAK